MMRKIFLKIGEKDRFYPELFKQSGYGLEYFPKVTSTQDAAKQLASEEKSLETVIVSDFQMEGRGRFHRKWDSNRGGLWFSILLFPKENKNLQLSLLAGISLAKTLKRVLEIKTNIKWPNDVMFGGKKLAGILIEAAFVSQKLKYLIIGVGINVNNNVSKDFRKEAVSLSEILNKKINRTELLGEIICDFEKSYEIFKKYGFKRFKIEFDKVSLLKNRLIRIEEGKIYRGVFEGIAEDGGLILKIGKDIRRKFRAGTILSYE